MTSRRLVHVWLEQTIFSQIMRGHGMLAIETDWPADAEIVDCWMDRQSGRAVLRVWSSIFDEVPEAAIIPSWSPTITYQRDASAAFLDLVRSSEKGA